MEPAVYAIGTTDTELSVIWLPGLDRTSPRGRSGEKEVIRMNDVGSGPTLQFVKRFATIIQALLVDEFEFSRRAHGTHESWNAIDDQAKTFLARAQVFLSRASLACCDASKFNASSTARATWFATSERKLTSSRL